MYKRLALSFLLLCLTVLTPAWAGPLDDLDAAMDPVAKQLMIISTALAADSTDGVTDAARRIAELSAKVHTTGLPGAEAGHLAGLEVTLKETARALEKASGLEAQRAAFKDLSKPVALWATVRQPEGIHVAYCPMAPGSWLQTETKIANPYYGASMLRCGQIAERSDGPEGNHSH